MFVFLFITEDTFMKSAEFVLCCRDRWCCPVVPTTWETEVVGSVLTVGPCSLVICVELVSTLSSMSKWMCCASGMSRLDNEKRIGSGWKHSRQKSPHGVVVG